MNALTKKFAEHKAAKKEKKANKPYWSTIVTSDFVEEGTMTNNLFGTSHSVSLVAHFAACSRTKVDPQIGRDAVVWDIKEVAAGAGHQTSEPVFLSITYKDMLKYMMYFEKKASYMEGRPDAEVIAERGHLVAKNNILKFV